MGIKAARDLIDPSLLEVPFFAEIHAIHDERGETRPLIGGELHGLGEDVFGAHRVLSLRRGLALSKLDRVRDVQPAEGSASHAERAAASISSTTSPSRSAPSVARRSRRTANSEGVSRRLSRCLDLLDPSNAALLKEAHARLSAAAAALGKPMPRNANTHKYLDCAVFNWLYGKLVIQGVPIDSCRAVFVTLQAGRGLPRIWMRSGVFEGAHIQLCVRQPSNILAVWSVRKDGRYGKDVEAEAPH